MKHTLKSRATGLATVLATTAILAGCSEETPPGEVPHNTETTIYATAQNQFLDAGATYYCPIVMPGFTSTAPEWYQIGVTLTRTKEDMKDRWVSRDTLYIKKVFSPAKITGIDVILLTDYDNGHPQGASIADQFVIRYNDTDTMDMKEYFRMGNTVDWREGRVCLLISRTLPSEVNNNDFFAIRHDRQKLGALLQLTLEDSTIIETRPSLELRF